MGTRHRVKYRLLALLCCLALPLLTGCELLRDCVPRAQFFALMHASYAGRFRVEFARWPTPAELEEYLCMENRARSFDMRTALSCDELVRLPWRVEMIPEGRHLRLLFLDEADRGLCELQVRAPPREADLRAFPMVVIKTTAFACSGDISSGVVADIG
jgi:hypothetical protein